MTGLAEVSEEKLAAAQVELVAVARSALERAYAPYSGVRVGAALVTPDGRTFSAANIENSAYGSTLCAERAAIAAAYAQGERDFSGLAVVIEEGGRVRDLIAAPCGACRQMLYEADQVSKTSMYVILSNPDGERFVVTDMDTLLPLAFGPGHLV